MKKSALIIGEFTKADNGVFTGKLDTLAIKATITLQPNDDKAKPNRPDFIVLHGQREIGVAWERTDDWSGHFVSIAFEEPSLAAGIDKLTGGSELGVRISTGLTRSDWRQLSNVKRSGLHCGVPEAESLPAYRPVPLRSYGWVIW